MDITDTDTASIIYETAKEHGLIGDGDISIIPELSSTIEEAADFLFEKAKEAMKEAAISREPELGMQAMCNICAYMFGKGVEAVFLWSDSADGNISIEFVPAELIDLDIQTDLDNARREIVISSSGAGDLLFNAHSDFVYSEIHASRVPFPHEQWIHGEMRKAISWSMYIGIGHAFHRGYDRL